MGKAIAHIVGSIIIILSIYAIPYAFFAGVLGFLFTLLDTRPGADERRGDRHVEASQQPQPRPASPRDIAERTIREMTRVTLAQRGRSLFISISSSNSTNYEATLSGFSCNFLLFPDIGPRGYTAATAVRQVFLKPGDAYSQDFIFPFEMSNSAIGSAFRPNDSFRIVEYVCNFYVRIDQNPLSAAGSPRNPLLLR